MKQTIDALREQLQQLQARHDRGELDAAALAAARAPLERELVAMVVGGAIPTPAPAQPTPQPAHRPSTGLVAAVTAAVVALAAVGYGYTGSPRLALSGADQVSASESAGDAADSPGSAPTEAQLREMVAKLADRLEQQPDDRVGWTMLGRSYSVMGQTDDAIRAFRKALALAGDDAGLMADLADVLAVKNNGDTTGEPARLVQRALELEPGNLKVLALAGSIAFDQRDFGAAVRHWEKVEKSLPPDSPFLEQVQASITEARQLGGLTPGDSGRTAAPSGASTPAFATGGASAPTVAAASAITGTVSLAASLKAAASPDDTVFIVARAAAGPGMPLAVLRKQVRDLPLEFSLDDSMAMAPSAKISDHTQVVVLARISKSGNASPQAGDLSGQSAAVAPGMRDIRIEINQTLDATAGR